MTEPFPPHPLSWLDRAITWHTRAAQRALMPDGSALRMMGWALLKFVVAMAVLWSVDGGDVPTRLSMAYGACVAIFATGHIFTAIAYRGGWLDGRRVMRNHLLQNPDDFQAWLDCLLREASRDMDVISGPPFRERSDD